MDNIYFLQGLIGLPSFLKKNATMRYFDKALVYL